MVAKAVEVECRGPLSKSGVPQPPTLWPLLVNEVPITSVELVERKVNSYLRRWLGLLRSSSTTDLYEKNNALQIPFSSITKEFKVSHTRIQQPQSISSWHQGLYWQKMESLKGAGGSRVQAKTQGCGGGRGLWKSRAWQLPNAKL